MINGSGLELNKFKNELREKIHEEFRFYRQSGLALSATLFILCGTLSKFVLDKMTFPLVYTASIKLFLVSITISIIAALAIQVCHYMGYKYRANRHFPKKNKKFEEWEEKSTNKSNNWFELGDLSVWFSVIAFFVGFFTCLYILSL